MQLAFANLESQLTKEIIAYEVYGDVAAAYEEVGEMEMKVAVDNWKFVRESEAMKDVGRMVERNEMPSFGVMSYRIGQKGVLG